MFALGLLGGWQGDRAACMPVEAEVAPICIQDGLDQKDPASDPACGPVGDGFQNSHHGPRTHGCPVSAVSVRRDRSGLYMEIQSYLI